MICHAQSPMHTLTICHRAAGPEISIFVAASVPSLACTHISEIAVCILVISALSCTMR